MSKRIQCGPCWAELDPARGAVRRLGMGGVELLHGVYAAARDASWGTAEPAVSDLETSRAEDVVTVVFHARSQGDEVDIEWRVIVQLRAAGAFSFDFAARTRGASSVNRLGLCVLHPVSVAGRACRVEHFDGSVVDTAFPGCIDPDVVFTDVRAIEHSDASGIRCRVAFTGDAFETEDQRNWTDLSFKTYCTPLRLPTPRRLRPGERVSQRVDVVFDGVPREPAVSVHEIVHTPTAATLSNAATDVHCRRPLVGCILCPAMPISKFSRAWSQRTGLDHVRLELTADSSNGTTIEEINELLATASGVTRRAEAALTLSEGTDAGDLAELLGCVQDSARREGFCIERLIALGANGRPPAPGAVDVLRREVAPLPVWVGADGNFTELNRQRPAIGSFDGLAFAANPQVHAFDDRSVAENVAGLAFCVRDARAMSDGLPVVVSPLTLLPRVNAAAPDANPAAPPADPRQREPFAAAWFVAAYAQAAASGAHAVTLGPLVGPAGLCNNAGRPYPIALAVRAVTRFGPARARCDERGIPGWAEALVLERDGRERWLIALFEDGRWPNAPSGEGRWITGSGKATETESGWALAAEGPGVFQIDCEA